MRNKEIVSAVLTLVVLVVYIGIAGAALFHKEYEVTATFTLLALLMGYLLRKEYGDPYK